MAGGGADRGGARDPCGRLCPHHHLRVHRRFSVPVRRRAGPVRGQRLLQLPRCGRVRPAAASARSRATWRTCASRSSSTRISRPRPATAKGPTRSRQRAARPIRPRRTRPPVSRPRRPATTTSATGGAVRRTLPRLPNRSGSSPIQDSFIVAARDPAGPLVLVGGYAEAISLGAFELPSSGDFDLFIAWIGDTGSVDEVVTHNSVGNTWVLGTAFDPASRLYVTGAYTDSPDFGGPALPDTAAGGYAVSFDDDARAPMDRADARRSHLGGQSRRQLHRRGRRFRHERRPGWGGACAGRHVGRLHEPDPRGHRHLHPQPPHHGPEHRCGHRHRRDRGWVRGDRYVQRNRLRRGRHGDGAGSGRRVRAAAEHRRRPRVDAFVHRRRGRFPVHRCGTRPATST